MGSTSSCEGDLLTCGRICDCEKRVTGGENRWTCENRFVWERRLTGSSLVETRTDDLFSARGADMVGRSKGRSLGFLIWRGVGLRETIRDFSPNPGETIGVDDSLRWLFSGIDSDRRLDFDGEDVGSVVVDCDRADVSFFRISLSLSGSGHRGG